KKFKDFLEACTNPANNEIQKTITALLKVYSNDCENTAQRLELETDLILSDQDIVDLSPLYEFKNFTRINLNNNHRFSDLPTIFKHWNHLKELDIKETFVSPREVNSTSKSFPHVKINYTPFYKNGYDADGYDPQGF